MDQRKVLAGVTLQRPYGVVLGFPVKRAGRSFGGRVGGRVWFTLAHAKDYGAGRGGRGGGEHRALTRHQDRLSMLDPGLSRRRLHPETQPPKNTTYPHATNPQPQSPTRKPEPRSGDPTPHSLERTPEPRALKQEEGEVVQPTGKPQTSNP